MLEKNPDQRPSAKEALGHLWFKQDEKILQELLLMNNIVCSNDIVMTPPPNSAMVLNPKRFLGSNFGSGANSME